MQGTKEELQTRQSAGRGEDHEDSSEDVGEEQQKGGGFLVNEMVTGQTISPSNSKVYIMNKINMLQNVLSLQLRVNNLNIDQKKTSYARFKVKQRNIFGLALIDTGNLVHPSIVSGEFWEAIGGRINRTMGYKVGTADSQSDGLQVQGLREPWPIYLEGIEECYILEPLVIKGLSHSVNLGIAFLEENNLKLLCSEKEVVLMPVEDSSASRARLVVGNCSSFEHRRSGRIWRATKAQEISTQAWRIPPDKISIHIFQDGEEKNVGVYAKE